MVLKLADAGKGLLEFQEYTQSFEILCVTFPNLPFPVEQTMAGGESVKKKKKTSIELQFLPVDGGAKMGLRRSVIWGCA